jgi:hypothetical protein
VLRGLTTLAVVTPQPRWTPTHRFAAPHPNHNDARADPWSFGAFASRCPPLIHARPSNTASALFPPKAKQCCKTRALITLWAPIQGAQKTL